MDGSNFVYGAAKISNLDLNTANELVLRISELGIREIDTAPSYGDSELILGSIIHQIPSMKINTKIGLDKHNKITSSSIRESLSKSLERLRVSKINTLFLHSIPSNLVRDEVFLTLEDLRNQGVCEAIAYSGDGKNLSEIISKSDFRFDSFMFTYNFLDQSNARIVSILDSNSELYIKRTIGNSVWRKRTIRDITKDLLGRSRGHDEYRNRFKKLYPKGIKNGYANSLNFVRYEFPRAKYLVGISNMKQCEELAQYIRNFSTPNRDFMEDMKRIFKEHEYEDEFVAVT